LEAIVVLILVFVGEIVCREGEAEVGWGFASVIVVVAVAVVFAIAVDLLKVVRYGGWWVLVVNMLAMRLRVVYASAVVDAGHRDALNFSLLWVPHPANVFTLSTEEVGNVGAWCVKLAGSCGCS
jgi:hypothetical protein